MKGQRDVDWGIVGLVLLLAAMFGLVITAVIVSINEGDAEPTSRCIDAEFRIFERNGDFSVAPDPDCAK